MPASRDRQGAVGGSSDAAHPIDRSLMLAARSDNTHQEKL